MLNQQKDQPINALNVIEQFISYDDVGTIQKTLTDMFLCYVLHEAESSGIKKEKAVSDFRELTELLENCSKIQVLYKSLGKKL